MFDMTLNYNPVKLSYKAVAKLQRLGVWFPLPLYFEDNKRHYDKWRTAYDNNYQQR